MRLRPSTVIWPVLTSLIVGCGSESAPAPAANPNPAGPAPTTTATTPGKKGSAPKSKQTFEKRLPTSAADSSGPPSEN